MPARSQHSIQIRDTLRARFPEIAFDIVGTYRLDANIGVGSRHRDVGDSHPDFCAKGASISWTDGPTSDQVYAALQPLEATGMRFICMRD